MTQANSALQAQLAELEKCNADLDAMVKSGWTDNTQLVAKYDKCENERKGLEASLATTTDAYSCMETQFKELHGKHGMALE